MVCVRCARSDGQAFIRILPKQGSVVRKRVRIRSERYAGCRKRAVDVAERRLHLRCGQYLHVARTRRHAAQEARCCDLLNLRERDGVGGDVGRYD